MFIKIVRIVFYAALALFFFGVGVPYLEILIGLTALILTVVEIMQP